MDEQGSHALHREDLFQLRMAAIAAIVNAMDSSLLLALKLYVLLDSLRATMDDIRMDRHIHLGLK